MGPWLRVGTRLEYAIAVFTIASFLIFGFVLTRSAPGDIRWMAWILVATFVFPFGFVALLIGRWLRRNQVSTAQTAALVGSRRRSKMYLVLAIVTTISASEQARIMRERRLFAATAADIFLWNFGALAALIAIIELSLWHKRLVARRG